MRVLSYNLILQPYKPQRPVAGKGLFFNFFTIKIINIVHHLREITAICNGMNWISALETSHHIFLPFIATVMKRLFNLYAKRNACRCFWLNALLSLCPLEYRNSDWLLVIVEGGIAEERVDISLDCGGGEGRGGGAYVTG
jgi:hypothetical protein